MDADERIEVRQPRQGWQRRQAKGGCGKLALLAIIAGFIALPFTPWAKVKEVVQAAKGPGKVIEREKIVEREKVVTKEIPQPPPPLPDKFVAAKEMNVATIFNKITIKNELELLPGDFASRERLNEDAYTVSFKVSVKIPKPNKTLEDLSLLNPHLPKALPGLTSLLPSAKVSGFFHYLYEQKERVLQINLTRVDKLIDRHNFFDLETALEIEHPQTKQKVLLLQGEMDVVSDGSDGDRMPSFDDYIAKSAHFQPTTSYYWPKLSAQPNPLLARYEEKLRDAKDKAKNGSKEEKKAAPAQADAMQRYIADLKSKSFLIAQEDPFIVISLSMKSYSGFYSYAPAIGDYALVIHEDKLFPAIIGDYGPREKSGEASLRLAKAINPNSSPYSRPVSDLKITYLIFPNSAEKPWSQPDLAKWTAKVTELTGNLGGVGAGYTIHQWEDRFKKPPPAAVPPPPPAPTPPAGADQKNGPVKPKSPSASGGKS